MPEVGEIRHGNDIGYKTSALYMWRPCANCGKKRWVALRKGNPVDTICSSCSRQRKITTGVFKRENNPAWKGGRYRDKRTGYILVCLEPGDIFYPMCSGPRYVKEHRLIMAKKLGRLLSKQEVVHHINGVRDDNRPENLQLLPNATFHNSMSHVGVEKLLKEIDGLKQLIEEQSKQIKLLIWQFRIINQVPGHTSEKDYPPDKVRQENKTI